MKKFNVRDGMGVELLLRNQINTIIITKENSEIVKQRGKKIKVLKTYLGVSKKENLLDEICKKRKISSSEIAYIGDDINDLEIMKRVGFSATPKDGMKEIKIISDYICNYNGGEGVFREVVDLILSFHKWKNNLKIFSF